MIHPVVKLVYTFIGLGILYYIFPHLVPFLVALVLAVLVEPVVIKLQELLRGRRTVAVTVNLCIFLFIAGGLVFWGWAKIINQVVALSQQLPNFANEVGKSMENLILRTQVFFADLPDETVRGMKTAIRDAVNLGDEINRGVNALLGTARAIPNIFIVVVVTLVSFYLFSLHLPEIKIGFLQIFSERAREKVSVILHDVNRAIIGFVRAQFIVSLLTYFFILAGLLTLDIRYAMAIAFLIVLVDILPILGTGFVMLPWAAFLFIVHERFTAMGIVILYILIIVFRRIIEPKILGDNIGLSALTTVISMYVGFKVLGIEGIFFGPAVCIIFKAMRKAGLFQEKLDF